MSPEQKVVAVIVPTFNRAELLQRALNSVLTQDVTRGLEVVVVDDGSADDIGRVVKSVADERVRLVRQDNGGVSRARNRGVEETDAEWVCFLDSDDVARAGWLEEMLSAASQGIDLFSCRLLMFQRVINMAFNFPKHLLCFRFTQARQI